MTEQQTAATDNALVEKLVETRPAKVCLPSGNPYDILITEFINPDGPEAAERIKSLQAEVAELRAQKWDVKHTDTAKALVEKLEAPDYWMSSKNPGHDEAPHEAAEFIRLLRTEIAEMKLGVAKMCAHITTLEADRQRMREALEAIRGYSEDNGMTRRKMRTIARTTLETAEALANRMGATFEPAALNPASKEANDEPEL